MKRIIVALVALLSVSAAAPVQDQNPESWPLWRGPVTVFCVYGKTYSNGVRFRSEIDRALPARVLRKDGLVGIICPDAPDFLGTIARPMTGPGRNSDG